MDRSEAEADEIDLRSRRLHHRGPFDRSLWSQDHVALAHTRLPLVDSHGGKQPMKSRRGVVVTYNGEIFNATELRAELIARGYPFRTQSDTEVLLASYETWGVEAWSRLNGMFAFALFDPVCDKLYLVRDREGVKPLYYSTRKGRVDFASEPAALASSDDSVDKLDPIGLVHFLTHGRLHREHQTLFSGIQCVRPGETIEVSACGAKSVARLGYPIIDCGSESTAAFFQAKLRHLLHLSVGRQALADSEVGAFLSGGVDSAIVAALMKATMPATPRTYAIALEGDEEDLKEARRVSEFLRTRHTECVLSADEFFERTNELSVLRGMPVCLPNEVLISALSERASSDVRAILSGEGADELFGGYELVLSAMQLYARSTRLADSAQPVMRKALSAEWPGADLKSAANFFASITAWTPLELLSVLLKPEYRDTLKSAEAANPYGSIWNECLDGYGSVNLDLFLVRAHLPHLLSRLDGAAMSRSVEGRVPYIDRDLVDFVINTPDSIKHPGARFGKRLLKQSFSDIVPEETLKRTKKPFDANLRVLLHSSPAEKIKQKLTHSDALASHFNMDSLRDWFNSTGSRSGLATQWLLISLFMWRVRNC